MTGEDKAIATGATRRPLLRFIVGGGALASAGIAARVALQSGAEAPSVGEDGAFALSTLADSDVQSLHLPLRDDFLPSAGRGSWESRRLRTSTHSMIAFTWGVAQPAPTIHIRSRIGGSWRTWQRVPILLDTPDGEPDERTVLTGTDLLWIGRADGVQVRVDHNRPRDLSLVLLYPERRLEDALLDGGPADVLARQQSDEPTARAPRPKLLTREEWGANEQLRDERPTYNHTLKQVHVHHTVNSNTYSRHDVPALIRGMYSYHTRTLGWSDIGYNFLVDRFGRGWVGRAGGPRRLVRGAHTLGFNGESTGVAVIGNYETAHPSDAALNMTAAIAAWKLDRFDRKPRGEIWVESEGSDKYRAGRTVRLPVIDGHRDTNDTACPGRHLYAALPKIRRRAARIINRA